MKRQFALLFALTFMVSGMATMAEEAAQETVIVENEIVETAETAETEWTAPFEDGDWLSIPEWNAEVYLPAGWLLTEVNEAGFIASDAEAAQTMTVTIEDFLTEETAEAAETAEETAEATAEETTEESAEGEAAVETAEGVELSPFESYLMGLGEEYELALMGEREAAIFTAEDSATVRFVQGNHLVTMTFAPAAEGGVADSALSVAETFYIYEPVELTAEEAADETDAEAAAEEAAAETDAE